MNISQTLTPDGFYQFAPDATSNNGVAGGGAGNGNAFASFLMGIGALTQNQPNWTTDIFGANSNPYSALFIQDNWHPTPTLTVNAGLRWDVFPGATEHLNRMEYFDSTLGYTVNGVNMTGGEVFQQCASQPISHKLGRFRSALGVTYRILKNGVVRGVWSLLWTQRAHISINQFNDDSYLAETTWRGPRRTHPTLILCP